MADIIIDVETRVNLRPLGDGLSAATAKASEFEKSINAANARVLAFGASAGLIYKLGEAFNGLVKSTIEVEKTLVDVNTLLNLSQKQIAEFGAELFNVAKASSQSYEMVGEAAKELARQGLGAEKVLQRTADAMNLAKLSGISASSAVETLTAVLGTFSEQGLNSATVVERLAAVDAKFAVSSEHLSDALKRSASSAVDANVSFNELIGVVTVVQERTARGGAVIGNAFKSIFTRLGRTEVLDDLANLGIAVKNTEGEILPTIQILKNLSASYSSLAPASKAFISEQVAGVYQIGTLKALMSDLSKENGRFAETQIVAANSSGSTSARIKELNTSLDAYLSRLGSAGKQFGAAFGKEGLMSGMKGLVGGATSLLEMMTPDPKNSEEIGNKIGVGLMKGLGSFLTGPGLLAVGFFGGKILVKFLSDINQAAQSMINMGKSMSQEQLQRQSLEQAIGREIQRQPALLDSVRLGTISIGAAQDQILAKLREEASLRQKILASATQMAGPLGAAGVLTTDSGVMYTKSRAKTKAKGFIPNFNYGQEIENAGASEHGYTAGKAYKTKIHDGRGKSFESFVNDNEDVRTVINSSGNLATFVTPPNGYGRGTTIAAKGFVPNFAAPKSFALGVAFEKSLNQALTNKESTGGSDILDFPRGYLQRIDQLSKDSAKLNRKSEYGDAKLSFNSGNKRSLISKYIRANKKKNIEGGEEFLDKHFSMFYKNGPEDNTNTTSSSLASLLNQNPSLIDYFDKSTKTKDGKKLLQRSASKRVSLTYLADKVLSSGFIPNFAPVTGGKFYDFDETLVSYPKNTNPRELYFPESVSKASLTPLGRSLVGTKNPINVLTAREINSREAIHNFLTKSRIPVNKVVTSGSMFKRLGLDSSEKKAEFASKIYQKYGQPMSLVDDSFENVRGFENLNNPDITAKLYKTRGQKGLGQSFNAGGFVPNFAEFFKYPFTQKIRGRDRSVPPSEISSRFKEYEDQLFNGGLASLGFSDVNDLNKLFNSNVEADFFARRNDNPYIIDAKAGYNDAQAGSYMKKIGPGGTFAKLKSNPKFLDFLTSKKVSVNNLREAMVFGNMGVLQENTLSKRGLMKASGFVPNFGTVYRGVNPKYGDTDRGRMSKGIINKLIGAIGPNYTDNEDIAEVFGSQVLSKKVNDKKLLRLGSYDEVAQLFAQNQHLMTPGLAGRIKNSTGEEQQAAIEQAGGELRAILKKRKFSGIKSPLHPADAKYLSEEKGLGAGNLIIPFAGGFVPNFGDNTPKPREGIAGLARSLGRGASKEAYLRYDKDGNPYVAKASHKTGNRRPEAIIDAELQVESYRAYKKALAANNRFEPIEPKHVGGGVLKQSFAAGLSLNQLLDNAGKESVVGKPFIASGEPGRRARDSARYIIKRYLEGLGLYVDGRGLGGNIIIPPENEAPVLESLKKLGEGGFPDSVSGVKKGLPPKSFKIIDYAKGFIPNFGIDLDDADQEFIRANIKGVRRADKIGALNFGSPFMMAKAGGPATYEQLAGFGDPKIADRLRGIVGKKGGRAAVLKSISAAGGFVPNFAGEPSKLGGAAKALGIGAIRALVDGFLGDGFVDSMEIVGLNNLTLDDMKMVEKVLAEPTKGKHRKAFERSLEADRKMQKKFVAAGYASMPARASGGFVPNFANYADSVMGLEENLSGNKATFHTSPFPHVRNSSQPTFSAAMADHGGLSNALKDSMKGQKEAGLMSNGYVPNFAINPRSPIKTDSGSDLVGLARQKLIAQINIQIEEFKKGNITRDELKISTKDLMKAQNVTTKSQTSLNANINRSANAHAKAAKAATDAAKPSFFSGVGSLALSAGISTIGGIASELGGPENKVTQGVGMLTSAASFAATGAMIGTAMMPGVGTAIGGGAGAAVGLSIELMKYFNTERAEKLAKSQEASNTALNNFQQAILKAAQASEDFSKATTDAGHTEAKRKEAEQVVKQRRELEGFKNKGMITEEEYTKSIGYTNEPGAESAKKLAEFQANLANRVSSLGIINDEKSNDADKEKASKAYLDTLSEEQLIKIGGEMLKFQRNTQEEPSTIPFGLQWLERLASAGEGLNKTSADLAREKPFGGGENPSKYAPGSTPKLIDLLNKSRVITKRLREVREISEDTSTEMKKTTAPNYKLIAEELMKLEEAIRESIFEFEKLSLSVKFKNDLKNLGEELNIKLGEVNGNVDIFKKTTNESNNAVSKISQEGKAEKDLAENRMLNNVKQQAVDQLKALSTPEMIKKLSGVAIGQGPLGKDRAVPTSSGKTIMLGPPIDDKKLEVKNTYQTLEDIFLKIQGATNASEQQKGAVEGLVLINSGKFEQSSEILAFKTALEIIIKELATHANNMAILEQKTAIQLKLEDVKLGHQQIINLQTLKISRDVISISASFERAAVIMDRALYKLQSSLQSQEAVESHKDKLSFDFKRQTDIKYAVPGGAIKLAGQEESNAEMRTATYKIKSQQGNIEEYQKNQTPLEVGLKEELAKTSNIGKYSEDAIATIEKEERYRDLTLKGPKTQVDEAYFEEQNKTLNTLRGMPKQLQSTTENLTGKEKLKYELDFLAANSKSLGVDEVQLKRIQELLKLLDKEKVSNEEIFKIQTSTIDAQTTITEKTKESLKALEESRKLQNITKSFFVDLANASDPIANLQRDVKNLAGSMQKGFEDAFVSFVDGTASAGDAFKGFVRSIAKEMAAMSARFTANLITNSLSQLGGTAFQSAQSYFGGSQGGVVRAATGGHITGGSGVRDDIPAILTGGEYVIKKGSVNKYGVDFLEKINAQKFASGGQALSNQYTLGTFSGNYGKGDSETLRGAPTPLLGGVDLNGGSFTMGQYNIDPRLSNMALGDENNPQNRIREDMAALDMERKIAFDDYSSDKRRALESFQKQKDDAAKAALINAAVQIGMAAISAKIDSYAASKQTAGASKDLATFNAETSGGATASLSKSGVRGGELYNQGVMSVTPGEFSFFGKSTPGSYNVGKAKLNPDQFKAYNSQMNMMKTLEASGVQFDKSMSVPDNLANRIAAQQVQLDAMKKDSNFWNKMFGRNGKASGGFISNGSGTKDDVPALLMGGEYVISKPAVQKYGVDFMSRVNSGSLTGFARGGSVGDVAPLGSGGSSSTGGNEDLIESINNLSAKIQSQLDKTGGGAGGGAISNNIEININVSESGEVKGSNTSSGDEKAQGGNKKTSEEEKQEENKKRQELASMLQGMITQTLVKEQRKGGLLEK